MFEAEMERAIEGLEEEARFHAWLSYGVEKGWVSDVSCSTHDMIPMRNWEALEFEEGNDPCVPVVRVWLDGMPSDEEYVPWDR